MQPNAPQFKPGQMVREHLAVVYQLGCQVSVEGGTDWYHPSKLSPHSTMPSSEEQAKA